MSEGQGLIGADGEFHVEDEKVDISIYGWEDWVTFVLFWMMAAVVFYQVFTRYILDDSAGWTEEIARYFLVAVVFVGASMSVRKNNHIQVDYFYRLMPKPMGRVLSTLVDIVRTHKGERRLVKVTLIAAPFSFWCFVIEGDRYQAQRWTQANRGNGLIEPFDTGPRRIVTTRPMNPPNLRIYAGQIDPKDASHFTIRYRAWGFISKLNGKHMQLAWTTLGTLVVTDFYVMAVSAGWFSDLRFIG